MIVLDTESLLIFYLGEVGADVVEDLLKKVLRGDIKGYLNVINLTEFYYILCNYSPPPKNLLSMRLYFTLQSLQIKYFV